MSDGTSSIGEKLRQMFPHIPHNRALGLEFLAFDGPRARVRLPYRSELVGNPDTGVLHGGAITALLDACCGMAVFIALPEPKRIVTLDLRIDYLKPALPGHDVVAEAECFKRTRHVAFVRSLACHGDPNAPIASAAGTFMILHAESEKR